MQKSRSLSLPKSKRPLFMPDFTAKNIFDVDFKTIKDMGIKHVLVDLDLTIRKKMTRRLEPEIKTFLTTQFKKHGFLSLSIASNNMLNLRAYSKPLDANLFQPFWVGLHLIRKPSERFYGRILTTLGAKASETVMIGDKLRGDVYGGNVAGMFTVMVKPKGADYWYDKILFTRMRERRILNQLEDQQ
ncbi:MAG: HAD hydrolase-like protein [Candidatus Saccharibacteria bacterium]|nr:HAD hydrolase-like protein [Candidatus Saccharibacteria bacterium]